MNEEEREMTKSVRGRQTRNRTISSMANLHGISLSQNQINPRISYFLSNSNHFLDLYIQFNVVQLWISSVKESKAKFPTLQSVDPSKIKPIKSKYTLHNTLDNEYTG